MGFDDADWVLVEHWQERGPNDLLFLPIIYSSTRVKQCLILPHGRRSFTSSTGCWSR